MPDMTLRDAIKSLLRYVEEQEQGRHAAEGSSLNDKQQSAVNLLTRYTSGHVPTDPDFPRRPS